MTMITPSYLGETIEYSSLHACRSTLEDPTLRRFVIARRRVRSSLRGQEYVGLMVLYTGRNEIVSAGCPRMRRQLGRKFAA